MMYYLIRFKNLLLILVWKMIYFFKFLPYQLNYKKRKLPSVIIIGTPKSGTTFLFDLMSQHPGLMPARIKEPHYFDKNYSKGEQYYRGMFPLKSDARTCFEASVNYFYSEAAANRIKNDLPNCKVLLLLRDPIQRCYSHYQMNKKDLKTQTFSEVISEQNHENIIYGFVEKSFYSKYFEFWSNLFNETNFLAIKSEDLFENPQEKMGQIVQFLGIEQYAFQTDIVSNRRSYPSIDDDSRKALSTLFKKEYMLLDRL